MGVEPKQLPSGDDIPAIGIGTWDISEKVVINSVQAAMNYGYTHVDTAEGYANEAEVGEAIEDQDREELFITSKVLPSNLSYGSVIDACESSLSQLGTEYLDLYLIHWPNPAVSLRETLHAMNHLHESGMVRNIGVSNFTAYQLSNAIHISDVPIAVNQVEYHPWLQRPELINYCKSQDVLVEASAPLARTKILNDETIVEISEEYDRSPAQIVLRWITENGIVSVPKSTSEEHIQANANIFDWELDKKDHERIDELDRNQPVYDSLTRDWSDDVYGIPQ